MSTNCALIIPYGDKFKSIRVSADGYPSHMLEVLNDHYSTNEKASELIEGGNCRVVYDNYSPDARGYHDTDFSQPNVTIVYRRDLRTKDPLKKEYSDEHLDTCLPDVIEDHTNLKSNSEDFKYISHAYLYHPKLSSWAEIPV